MIISTGSSGRLKVFELNADEMAWTLQGTIQIEPGFYGMGVTTVNESTYLLTW